MQPSTSVLYENKTISMSNALIRAAHGLSLPEKRLIGLAVSKINPTGPAPQQLEVAVTAAEFAKVFHLSESEGYRELSKAADNLFEREIKFKDKAGTVTRMRWVGAARYAKYTGQVQVSFWHEVVPHLVALADNFTSYQLACASGLKSQYSWRLLELLKQFQGTGFLTISVPELHHALDAPESCRNRFNNFLARIIGPAVGELNKKNRMGISVEAKKEGRKVTRLEFRFRLDTAVDAPAAPAPSFPAAVKQKKTINERKMALRGQVRSLRADGVQDDEILEVISIRK